MSVTKYPDSRIANATLSLQMEDGLVLLLEGRPDTGELTVELYSQPFDLSLTEGLRRPLFPLKEPDTLATTAIAWTNPRMSTGRVARGWRGRFKRWLKAFPTS